MAGQGLCEDGDLEKDLEKAGAPAELLESVRAERNDEKFFEVLEENWDAVMVVSACGTQWERSPMSGQPLGLKYSSVESVMRMLNVKDTTDTFWRVHVIENEYLKIKSRQKQ